MLVLSLINNKHDGNQEYATELLKFYFLLLQLKFHVIQILIHPTSDSL
jgi:hypothetical protein